MPRSANGIGTVHFGRSAETDDGSYVTTVWFAIFFLPIFPLRSERILPLSEFDSGAGQAIFRYSVLARVPRDWPEITKTFLVGWGILAWYVSLIWTYAPVSRIFPKDQGHWLVLIWFLLPFGLLFAWQRWFRPRAKLRPVEVLPGSEFSVYLKRDGK